MEALQLHVILAITVEVGLAPLSFVFLTETDNHQGTWQGVINHLDYIQNMGFTALWISPVVQNIQGQTADGDSYHGYWAQKIVS